MAEHPLARLDQPGIRQSRYSGAEGHRVVLNDVLAVVAKGGALYCGPFRHVVPDDPRYVRVVAALIHEPPCILLSNRDGPENLL